MAIKFSNNARAALASSVASTDTTITVGDASVFPALAEGDVLYLTIANVTNTLSEIVKCTAINGNVLTISRGAEGTTPRDWTDLDNVSSRLTTELLETITSREYLGLNTNDDVVFNSITLAGGDPGEGKFVWNNLDNTVDLQYNGVTLQLGQEQHFYGKAIGTINNGDVVMFAGAQGDHLLMTKADASVAGFREEWVIGVATQNFVNNEYGYVTTFGVVRQLNTSGFAEGDLLYFDVTTPGALTNIEPAKPNHTVLVAAVSRSHATEGSIFVRPSFRSALNELHNVEVTNAVDGDLVAYDSSTQKWVNTSTPSADYVDFKPLDPPTDSVPQVTGRVYFNSEYQALTVYNDITGSSLQVGHEDWVRVYNNTGSTIVDGTPVYITGAFGETPTIAPGNATAYDKHEILGVVTATIADGTHGVVTTRGLVSGIDTSGIPAGNTVHLGITGGVQADKPSYPYWVCEVGKCIVSDATNGYIYVHPRYYGMEVLQVEGNSHMGGNLTVSGDLVVQGTQSIVSQNNLAINDSFIYLNSGDNIGSAGTTFTGTGLNDAYFAGYFEGTSTTTYSVRIDGVGTGTGGVDTFEWSTDGFTTTQATGVDLAPTVVLADNITIKFNTTTGHTAGDTWEGTASPVNVDTGWATNRNTGASGVGYTHMGVFFDASDAKFKFFDQYTPEPNGTIDTADASFSLGTVVADTFEGTATNASKLDNNAPSYYLNYNNFTNKPTIGNGTITVTAGDGLGTGGSFALNDTANKTVTLTNTDKGSSQSIFKTISSTGQNSVIATSNTAVLNLEGGGIISVATNPDTNTVTFSASETSHADVLVDGDFTTNGFMKRTAAGVYAVDTNTYALSSHTHAYLPTAGGTMTGKLVMHQINEIQGTTDTLANNARLSFKSSNGSLSAPTQTLSGDTILTIDSQPYTGSGFTGGAKIRAVASENITATNRGTNLELNAITAGQAVMSTYKLDGHDLYVTNEGGATSKFWHEGNDGANSGLDADKLDGKHASDFALAGHTHSYDNYQSWTISDGTNSEAIASGNTLKVVGSGATTATYTASTNTLTISSTDNNTVYTHPTSHPASMISTVAEFGYSTSTNVQDVLDDLDAAIGNLNTGKQASGTYLAQAGSITSGTITTLTSTTANIGTVDFGDWTITESNGALYFATAGTNKMKLDSSGNLQVVGNIEANATIS